MTQPNQPSKYNQVAEAAAKNKAEFCLSLGIAPSEYDNLTMLERRAFIELHNKRVKESKKGGKSGG